MRGLFALVVLISIFIFIEIFGIQQIEKHKRLKKEMHPDKYYNYTGNVDREMNYKIAVISFPIVIFLLIIGFLLILYIPDSTQMSDNSDFVAKIYLFILALYPVVGLLIFFLLKQSEMKDYKKYLFSKYNSANVKEIIGKKRYLSDFARYKYVFCFVVPECNCIVRQYYYQEFYAVFKKKRWNTICTMMEYEFMNVKNFPDFNDLRMQEILNQFLLTRSLEFEIDGSFIVRKRVAENPTDSQVKENVDDVELFYTYFLNNYKDINFK